MALGLSARWVRVCFPGPGAAGDQDERLMQALELLATVHNALLRDVKDGEADA